MNEFTVKIALEDADRARLDALTASIHRLADVLLHNSNDTEAPTPAPLPPDMMDAAFKRFLAQQERQTKLQQAAKVAGVAESQPAAVIPEVTAPAPATDAAPAEIVPLPDFQAAIAKKCAASPAMKAAVRKLVNQYAPSVSEIPENKRAEVMAALDNLAV